MPAIHRTAAVAFSGLALVVLAPGAVSPSSPPARERRVHADARRGTGAVLAGLPLSFEPNLGQAPKGVRFLAQGPGYSLSVTSSGATFALAPPVAPGPTPKGVALRMSLVTAEPSAATIGRDRLPGVVNRYQGEDPGEWLEGIPTFGGVRSTGVYPGIDLVFRGTRARPEYDFVLAPGADPGRIGLSFEGATGIRLSPAGDLVLSTPLGRVVHGAPRLFQPSAAGRLPVNGGFRLRGDVVGFRVGAFDLSRPLVIDPPVELVYSTFVGLGGGDSARGVAADPEGFAYVAGQMQAAPPGNPRILGNGGFATPPDAYVTKLDTTAGGPPEYTTILGGSSFDEATSVAIDGSGAAYAAGRTADGTSDFPTTPGAFDTTHNGIQDAFVVKLDAAGAVAFSTFLGGNSADSGLGIAVDGSGAAYVTGETYEAGVPFPTTGGAFDTSHNGFYDAFITKVPPSGGGPLAYSTFLGGDQADSGRAIAVDGSGAAYVVGETGDGAADLPTTGGAFDPSHNGSTDAFVTKVPPSGGASLAYSTFLGGNSVDAARGIAVDGSGAAYVTGYTFAGAPGFPTTGGAFDTTHNGSLDAFVTKVPPGGAAPLAYSTFLGGAGGDLAEGIAVDGTGAASVAGRTSFGDVGFPTTPDAFDATVSGIEDAFVTTLLPSGGGPLSYSTLLGGGSFDAADGIDEAGGSLFVVGNTGDSFRPFPTTPGAALHDPAGLQDGFLARLGPRLGRCGGRDVTQLGGPGKDVIKGSPLDDVISGLGGKDTLKGLGGDDRLCGGGGKDALKGGKGDDLLLCGGGTDKAAGGSGRDKARKCEKGNA